MNKRFQGVFVIACGLIVAGHVAISLSVISRWLGSMLHLAVMNARVPVERRMFTMSMPEYEHILAINSNLPQDANILWLPQADPIINYYIYPRRMYRIGEFKPDDPVVIEKKFIEERGIKYVFIAFGELVPVEAVNRYSRGRIQIREDK